MKKTQAFSARIFQRLWHASATKYVLVLVAAGLWMLLFDRYSWQSKQKVKAQIEEKERDISHYSNKIQELDNQQYMLEHDAESMERLAREKYYMKKPNEDVFPVVPQ